MAIEWTDVVSFATKSADKLGPEYAIRLEFELKEIEKQAASDYFMQMIIDKKKYDTNKNGLVLPFLLKITSVDPIIGGIKHVVNYEADYPDIDSDFTPIARDPVKKFISEKFGHDKVCTVGNWNTLKLKQAMLDSCRILSGDMDKILSVTKNLSDDLDEMDLDDILANSEEFKSYYETNRDVVELALRLKGRIKSQGQHAGGVIISNVNLADTIPMSIINGKHVSQWTEGLVSTQLSKFGLVKFDILGLKTMAYNVYTEQLVKKTRNIAIDWSTSDPTVDEPYFGHQVLPDGTKVKILMNDPKAIAMADEVKTEAVFQFDTPVAKGVLSNGVKSFFDLVTYTALARPGPMECLLKGSLINTSDGYKKIEELNNDDNILYMSKNGIQQTNKFQVFYNGKKKIKKITLKNGKIIFCTDNHIVMTKYGFCKVKDIKKGDMLYVKRRNNQTLQ